MEEITIRYENVKVDFIEHEFLWKEKTIWQNIMEIFLV